MNVKEFSKYVIDNLHRATLSNALNIAVKIDNPEFYTFNDFVSNLQIYVTQLLKDKKLDDLKCYALLVTLDKSYKLYNSSTKYNKSFIIDDLLISMWRIIDGT